MGSRWLKGRDKGTAPAQSVKDRKAPSLLAQKQAFGWVHLLWAIAPSAFLGTCLLLVPNPTLALDKAK